MGAWNGGGLGDRGACPGEVDEVRVDVSLQGFSVTCVFYEENGRCCDISENGDLCTDAGGGKFRWVPVDRPGRVGKIRCLSEGRVSVWDAALDRATRPLICKFVEWA